MQPQDQSVRRTGLTALMLVMLFAMSGCAQLTSIYRSENVPKDSPHLVSVDAKQRVILSNEVEKALAFCTEPPPDVFMALAASLGAEVSVARGGDPSTAAKLATTISENAATIERSQTINILRESMYRNCERYLSRAIDKDEFVIQAARDQQLIVQVLAIEQITGAARAQATALTTVAKAAASGVTDTGLETLAGAKKDLETKTAASDKAVADANALAPTGSCAAPLDPAAPPANVTADQAKAKNAACAAAKTALERTKDSQAYLSTVREAVARQSEVSSAAQGAVTSAALTAAAVSEAVAKQVVEIVKQTSAFDEIAMTCVVKMRRLKATEPLPDYCVEVIRGMFQTRQAQLLAAEGLPFGEINPLVQRLTQEVHAAAAVVHAWLLARGGVTDGNLTALESASKVNISKPTRDALLKAGSDVRAFSIVFQRLTTPKWTALLAGAK